MPLTYFLAGCNECPASSGDDEWTDAVAPQLAEFNESGTCPDTPPERGVMSWGCEYVPETQIVDGADRYIEASFWLRQEDAGTVASVSLDIAEDPPYEMTCTRSGVDSWHTRTSGDPTLDLSVRVDLPGLWYPPVFVVLPDGAGGFGRYPTEEEDPGRTIGEGAYGWVCLESASGGENSEGIQESWGGSAFFHADDWEGSPLDVFVPLDEVNCVPDEVASTYDDGTYGKDCDGIDNDYDGLVDEGAEDTDLDGTADCVDEDAER
ncbi:MAG: hypothetical protein ACOZNI_21205 [Myxococcota bacterium]